MRKNIQRVKMDYIITNDETLYMVGVSPHHDDEIAKAWAFGLLTRLKKEGKAPNHATLYRVDANGQHQVQKYYKSNH